MASAYECDRCKKLFPKACIPKYRLSLWTPSLGSVPIDLCPECNEELEDFINNPSSKPKEEVNI